MVSYEYNSVKVIALKCVGHVMVVVILDSRHKNLYHSKSNKKKYFYKFL